MRFGDATLRLTKQARKQDEQAIVRELARALGWEVKPDRPDLLVDGSRTISAGLSMKSREITLLGWDQEKFDYNSEPNAAGERTANMAVCIVDVPLAGGLALLVRLARREMIPGIAELRRPSEEPPHSDSTPSAASSRTRSPSERPPRPPRPKSPTRSARRPSK